MKPGLIGPTIGPPIREGVIVWYGSNNVVPSAQQHGPVVETWDALVGDLNDRVAVFEEYKGVLKAALR